MSVGHLGPSNPGDQVPLVATGPREGSEVIYATHNFCNKTTWYEGSVRVSDEVLTDSGDGLKWGSAHTFWIDMVHGRVMDEDALRQDISHGYLVVVTVDGVAKTQREAYEEDGGDFSVNYATGEVTFFASQSGKTVLTTYSYASSSEWILRPEAGKDLDLEMSEAQFSADIEMTDTLRFAIRGWAAVFAPEAVAAQQLQPTDLVELGVDRYLRFHQLADNALGSYPVVPALGGSSRGAAQAVYGFPFRYGTLRRLHSEYGMELRITLEHDRVFGGEYGTATFYCLSRES